MIETHLRDLPHGITLSCRETGPLGGRVLMFVHGFPEAAFVWDGLMRHFAQPEHGGYRCVAPNLRGYERSSQPTGVEAYRAKHLMQDLAALAAVVTASAAAEGSRAPQPLAALIAHDWGGAVAWGLAATQPARMERLIILNAPHPATFQRELAHNPAQQASSAYMNFLTRPDAPDLLAADDFARLWPFFENMGATNGPHAWLTPEVRNQYRDVWRQGLHGPCAYYAASPLRPPTETDPAAAGVQLPPGLCRINVPTQVIWGLADTALPLALLDGLEDWVPRLRVDRVPGATHWLVHEQPDTVIRLMSEFLN